MKDFTFITPETKKTVKIMPFVTFPLTKKCNFKCLYCGHGGELSASMKDEQDFEVIKERIYEAYKMGVRKFRLTGGEPFLYPYLREIIEIINSLGVFLHINSNGYLIEENLDIMEMMQNNIKFAISLDSLKDDKYDYLTGAKGGLSRAKNGIEIAKKYGKLLRLNMVVTKYNKDEIFDIIDYCSSLGCNLKLLDVVSVPLPYSKRDDLHVSFVELEEQLSKISDLVTQHSYARGFGTPCHIYKYKDVEITVKSTWNGSHYDINGICKGCAYYPCHEGLYDIFSLPDGRVIGCRWSEESVSECGNFKESLEKMAQIFQNAKYVGRDINDSMEHSPDFVINSLKNAGQTIPDVYNRVDE